MQLRLGAEEAARALPEVGRVAAPVIQSAAEQAADVAQKQAPIVAEKLAAGVEAAKPVLQSTGGTVGKALSGALTPEQLQVPAAAHTFAHRDARHRTTPQSTRWAPHHPVQRHTRRCAAAARVAVVGAK